MKRNQTAMRKLSLVECQVCGGRDSLARHHIWNRSLSACDDMENLIVLCRDCHDSVHDKSTDLGVHLTASQGAKCVLLAGTVWGAFMHLYPSESPRRTYGIGFPE